jgi:ParB-like chromosome segregation protein Spo0J
MLDGAAERSVRVATIGERLGALRLCAPEDVASLRRSLERQGQLTAMTVFTAADGVEMIDGFKRLRAARALGWEEVHVRALDVDIVEAKLAIVRLHDRTGLTEMEEAWLVRSLYRDHGLSQPVIGARLGRHKSWVSRRLLVAEALDEAVQADVHLGLLAPRAAAELAQLPRGNQQQAAQVVARSGMTVRQTVQLVGELLACRTDVERTRVIQDRLDHPGPRAAPRPVHRARTPAEWILADVATVRCASGRLESHLLAQPLAVFGPRVAEVTAHAARDLLPVLHALGRTIQTAVASGGAE